MVQVNNVVTEYPNNLDYVEQDYAICILLQIVTHSKFFSLMLLNLLVCLDLLGSQINSTQIMEFLKSHLYFYARKVVFAKSHLGQIGRKHLVLNN